MPAGKAASQAGHAFLDSYISADQELRDIYRLDGHGTKVALVALDLAAIERAHADAKRLLLPCALVTDSGHVLPPHFDGSPVVTALGIGPVTRWQAAEITDRFTLM